MGEDLRGKYILVVEDDYDLASELSEQMTLLGLEVIGPVSTVDEALELVRSDKRIAGAVLDINLDGDMVFPVADELERRAVPFIFATGYERDIVPPRHADKILLRKPVDPEAVVAGLTRATYAETVSRFEASRNEILARLPEQELDLISSMLRKVYLPRSSIMETPGNAVSRIYFPIDCVGSLIAVGREGSRVETGLIGVEGMTGFGIAVGDDQTPYELVNQVAGFALAMTVEDFKTILVSAPHLHALVSRFARALSMQVSFTALANGRFTLRERLARWFVMIHDRISGEHFTLTHEYMGIMLGVRRSSVTDALHILEGEGLIRSTRSNVEILDRAGLLAVAGECYGMPENEYSRLMNLPFSAPVFPIKPDILV